MRLSLACILAALPLVYGYSEAGTHSARFLGHDLQDQRIVTTVRLNDTAVEAAHTADRLGRDWKVTSWYKRSPREFTTWNILLLRVGWALVLALGVGAQLWEAKNSEAGFASMLTCATLKGSQPLHIVVKENIMPAMTVTLVSIPLSMALGIAAGAGPVTGLITAVIGGGVAGCFGSSAFNIVGPAGALAGLLMRYSIIYGPDILPWLSLVSAVLVFVMTALKLHTYCMFMPKCVFEGFTLGVALTIGLGQLDAGLGLRPGPLPHVHGIELSPLMFKLAASFQALHTIQVSSISLFLIGVVGMLLLFKWKPSIPWLVPFALVTLVIGALCDPKAFGVIDVLLPTLRMRYGFLEPNFANPLVPLQELIEASEANGGTYGDFMVGAMSVAFVAVLETLISAKIAASKGSMDFDTETELWGLGLSHIACGICGAMPPTGVFVRTSVNLRSGATHKTSQALHAILIAILLALCIRVCSFLPESAVAAILVVSSIRMAPLEYIASTWQHHKHTFGLLFLVAALCFVIDSVVGLVVGTIVGLLWVAKETAQGHAEVSVSAQGGVRNSDGSPQMISIDASAIDKTVLAPFASKIGRHRTSMAFENIDNWDEASMKNHRQQQYCIHRTRSQFISDTVQTVGSEPMTTAPSCRGDRVYLYRFLGQVSYLNGEKHVERLNAILECTPKAIVLDLGHVSWIDADGIEAFEMVIKQFHARKVEVFLAAPRPLVQMQLDTVMANQHEELLSPRHVVATALFALEAALEVGGVTGKAESSSADDDGDDEDEEAKDNQ